MKKLKERKKQKKYWVTKNDKLWGEIIRSKGKCEICGRQEGKLDPHHLFVSRACKHTRWNLNNGICICFICHRQAHDSPVLFFDKLFHIWSEVEYLVKKNEVINASLSMTKQTWYDYQLINIALKRKLELLEDENE